ncbi:DUF4838 domain-containing protein [Arenibacter latericius]|uniref:DUF4838 domain-containing protein n=1 Tax=Arenibacter latericius TaxID=86104 RepID=UPI000404841D|nr:DUF4838 domain-containing protein [Arenibacter latericius]
MWHFSIYRGVAFLFMWVGSFAWANSNIKAKAYVLNAIENNRSDNWAAYAYSHLLKRSQDKSTVQFLKNQPLNKIPEGTRIIQFHLVADLEHDYCIEDYPNRTVLRFKNDKTAVWIIYQLIDAIAEVDNRFQASDLPPSIINFETHCKDFDFSYREPHFLPNLEKGYSSIIGTNNVDTDWGLWGHNLGKVVNKEVGNDIYSRVDGDRVSREQFCFSSELLVNSTYDYIINQFGDGTSVSYRFMIMPQDNDLVCTCNNCIKLGNTTTNATPAVTNFINKLGKLLPLHYFFTSAYRTTIEPPTYNLGSNIGVFISTADLPRGINLKEDQPSIKTFISQLKVWKEKSPAIYLWDYASNFDDYLTPVPVLFGLQKQLRFFKKYKVKGIFLNASGYDYSSFDDLKTYISAALLMDVEVNIEKLIRRYLQRNYPKNHQLLAKYYLEIEDNFQSSNKAYPMYGGMRDILNTYIDSDHFIDFYNKLKESILKTQGIEKVKLKKLITALSFTRLQIAYTKQESKLEYNLKNSIETSTRQGYKEWILMLKDYDKYTDLNSYREVDGDLKCYLDTWQSLLSGKGYKNLLKGTTIESNFKLESDYNETYLLNDGLPGFKMDYHQGWYISSKDSTQFSIKTQNIQNAKTIKLRFLVLKKHRFHLPKILEFYSDGKLIKTFTEKDIDILNGIAELEIDINLFGTETLTVRIEKPFGRYNIGLDEIQIN